MMQMVFSIVIPVYNECKKIVRDIQAAEEFLIKNDFHGEIIIVDDGSTDTTIEAAESVTVSSSVSLKIIQYKPHNGKGYAVKTGVVASTGDYVLCVDSGLCVPYTTVISGLELLNNGICDCAHGSRKLEYSNVVQPQSWSRQFISRIFRWIFVHWFNVPSHLTDTQCGFKVYKGDTARNLFKQCATEGFLYEIEIILRAQNLGIQIREFPIEWTVDPDSRLSVLQNSFGVLRELLALANLDLKEKM